MKTSSSLSLSARTTFAVLLLLAGAALLCTLPFVGLQAQIPTGNVGSGNVGPSPGGATASFTGVASAPGGGANTEAACVEGANCETFNLTVDGTDAQWANQKVQVQLTWSSTANEYDLYIHKGTLAGPVVASNAAGPGLTAQTAFIDIATNHTGAYVVHIVYDTTPTAAADHYHGTVIAVPLTPVSPPAATQDAGPKVGYENFEPPGVLTPITQSSSGGITYEYMGRNAIEPSIGVNFMSHVVNYQSDLETLFLTFGNDGSATWVNRRAPTSQFVDSDPIGFTDRTTHRVFASELTLLSPDTAKTSYTDDDGVNWTVTQGSGLASAVDHQTIGGGPYHLDSITHLPPPHSATYDHAVYYCSQDIALASCSRSDDGGATFGASVPMYNLTACGGLHGHVKVSPVDGTVYVPNRACGTTQAMVVSQDNGATWAIRPVQNGTTASVPSNIGTGDDPAVGVDNNGRVYFAFSNAGTAAGVAYTDNAGVTWNNIVNVSDAFGLKNVCFPAAVGGDINRAAFAFYGSKSPGSSSNDGSFTGVWRLYVAHTFDGGATWTTTDVTPTLPMQRSGLLRGGGADIVRNLADFFDITMDQEGRVLVGYGNGCAGGPCSQAPVNPDGTTAVKGNAYSATASIARQSSGRRLLAAFDPPNPLSAMSPPGMPFVTVHRIGNVATLAWNQADTGNSTITSYQILRSTTSGTETLLATIAGSSTGYTDYGAADSTKTYFYKVVAVNGVGSSLASAEVTAPYVGTTCNGVIIHRNDPSHPEATGGGATNPPIGPTPTPAPTPGASPVPQLLIDYIAVGEPAGSNDLMFKIKVGNLGQLIPNSRWRIAWDWWTPTTQLYYVGMTTDGSNNVSFEYGTLADAGVPAVLVLSETTIAAATGSYSPDGTITIFVPKSGVGNPQPGDLLGAIGGKTITGDTPQTNKLERSTTFVDHTFVKGNSDNSFPAATYTVMGNGVCAVQPLAAVSRKTHGGAGTFDVPLPLTGAFGIEDRTGPTAGVHQVVITFPTSPVTVNSASVAPGQGGTATVDSTTISGDQVTVNLSNVSNAQLLTVNLLSVTTGGSTGDVSIPMGVLLGDVNMTGRTDSGDVTIVRNHTVSIPTAPTTFRYDVNCSGRIDSGDVTVTRNASVTAIP